ncbi:MAG: serine/threonine protein kinase [Myxococcales bacterium]|nr:serine/threonine protein kinase [Myxococcales bacterium]
MLDRIGNCRIIGEIGSGGMAVIYKAVQEPLERVVAIKALKPSIAVDSQFAMRFEREARFMASLQHENILHVHDFIKDGETMYIVMEYVQGIDLYDLLQLTPRLPVDVAAIIALQVARALDYAHFRGIIHRDIKPANVIISHQGEVKLMDFGIARDHSLSDLTETGTGVGTPSYMSPEQILGDKLDFRSDIFSLGIVLYQCITGQKPFVEDEARTVMQKIRLDRYASPRKVISTVPSSMERILARCMEKIPSSRYPSTQALIDDLMEFLAGRVGMNHSARLVMYMRDVGVIGEIEADEILNAGATRTVGHGASDRRLVRHSGMVFSAALAAVLATGAAIQASAGSFSGGEDKYSAPSDAPIIPHNAGYLRVVVDPWADVYVDGEKVVTTPTAQSIALSPGKHYVKYKNPYYHEQTQEIVVRPGETKLLEAQLKPKHVVHKPSQETAKR